MKFMDINQALIAKKFRKPVIANWPTTGDVEYERILSVHATMPEYKVTTPSAVLKDKCGHSVTIADLKNIRLKEKSNV